MSSADAKRERGFGYALVAMAACGWGIWPLVLRHAPMPASLQSAVVMTVMTAGSVPVLLKDRVAERARRRDWLAVGWMGIADAANVGLFFAAYQRTTVAIAVLTHYLTPIFVALSAPLVLGEKLRAHTRGAVAVSFVGLFLLLAPWRAELGPSDFVGAALGAGSAVCYASNVLAQKHLRAFSAAELMVYHGILGTILLWLFVPGDAIGGTSMHSLAVVIAGALGIGTFCGLSFTWGLKRIHASRASVLTLLEPFVAVVTAALFLGQRIGLLSAVGGLLILGGALAVVVQSDPT